MTPFSPKTPTQMRLETERRTHPAKSKPTGQPDPARRPINESETGREIDATTARLRAPLRTLGPFDRLRAGFSPAILA